MPLLPILRLMRPSTIACRLALRTARKRGGVAALRHGARGQVAFALGGGSVGVLGRGGVLQVHFKEHGDALLVGLDGGTLGGGAAGGGSGGRGELLCELEATGQL